MLEKDAGSVLLDFCESCEGVFLDFGEIVELAKDGTHTKKEVKKIQTGDKQKDHDQSVYACPNCGYDMEEREYAFDSGVHVDWCQNCDGMYLNKGELRELKSYLSSIHGGSTESKENIKKGTLLLQKHRVEYEEKEKINKEEIDDLYSSDDIPVINGIVEKLIDVFV